MDEAAPRAAAGPTAASATNAGAVLIPGQSAGLPARGTYFAASTTPPFAALDSAPGMARGHVKATLALWGLGGVTDTATLIASELVSNAVEASAKAHDDVGVLVIWIGLIAHGDVLAIECWDQAPGVPLLRTVPALANRGRGLAIVNHLTGGAWGCQPLIGQSGKCVWAQIPLRDGPAL